MRYFFGDCELNTDTQDFMRGGQAVHAEPQVLAVLEFLIVHSDRVVPKIELLDEVWGSRFVSESTLTSRIKTARRLCGDTGRDQRVIRTIHGRGYRFVAELASSFGAGSSDRHDRSVGGLVGREDELRLVEQALADGSRGVRSIVAVTGPAGIGKSAFLAEATERFEDGWQILRGQALPGQGGTAEPYFPLLDALSRAGRSGNDAVAAALDAVAPTWLAQIPALVAPDAADRLERRVLGANPERMLREGAEVLEELTRIRPVALVLEDLHWADVCTLDVLELLVRRRDPARLVVLASLRDDRSPAAELVATAVATGGGYRVDLDPLTDDEVDRLVSADSEGASIAPDLLELIRDRAGGVPLFVLGLVRAWRWRGDLIEVDGTLRAAGSTAALASEVPDTLRQLVEQDLERLDPATVELLESAALVGTSFDAGSVAAAVDAEIGVVDAALTDIARRHHHIDAVGGSSWPSGVLSTAFEFGHELYRQVLAERPSVHRRALVHANVGRALEAGYAGQVHLVVGRLAEHFVQAGNHGLAAEYLRQVGEQAASRSAFGHAVDALLDALDHVGMTPAGPERDHAELRVRLALGPALVATRGWFGDEVAENYERALAICAASDPCPEAALARYGLATVTELRGEYARTEKLLEPLVGAASEVRAESQELMACSTFHQGKFELSLRHATEVIGAWDGSSESAVLARLAEHPVSSCNSWASLAAWGMGRFDDSLRFAERAIEIGEHHLYALSTAQVQRAFLHQLRREPQACREWAAAAIELAESQGFPMRAIQAEMLLGWADAVEGSADGSARIADALDRFRATGARLTEPYFLGILADAALADGRLDDAIELLEQALTSMAHGSRTFFAGPELHRLTALALARRDRVEHSADIASHLTAAINDARRLNSPVLELRATVDAFRIGGDSPDRTRLHERLGTLIAELGSEGGADVEAARSMLADLV